MLKNPSPAKAKSLMDKVAYDIIKAICPVVDSPVYQRYFELAAKSPITALKCLCSKADIQEEVVESFWLRMELEGIKDPIDCSITLTRKLCSKPKKIN